MLKDWLVQAAFPASVYQALKIEAARRNLSIKSCVVELVREALLRPERVSK